MKLVPEEPTPLMIAVGRDAVGRAFDAGSFEIIATAVYAAMVAESPDPWNGPMTAPTCGREFLGLLSNGHRTVVSAPAGYVSGKSRYAWWDTESRSDVPIEESHVLDAPLRRLRLVGWMELPPARPKN